jgi:hypothetical protein
MAMLAPVLLPLQRTHPSHPRWASLGSWLAVWEAIAARSARVGADQRRQEGHLQRHLLALGESVVEATVDLSLLDRFTWTLTDSRWKWTWRTWAREPELAHHRPALLDAADRRRSWLYRSVSAREYWPALWLNRVVERVQAALTAALSEADLQGFLERRGAMLQEALDRGMRGGFPPMYYASGTNHVGEVRGYAAVSQPIGVTAPEVSEALERSLLQLAGTGARVFVDSGAFGEFTQGVLISEAEWARRLALYTRLAEGLGNQLAVVAPDKVGDQDASLERLRQHQDRMRHLQRLGAQVIVPLQVGSRSLVEVYDAVWKLLRCPFTPGLPANKAALSEADLVALLEQRKPERVHFLGLGPRTRQRHGRRLLEIARTLSPGTRVSMDSALRKALVGRASGLRPLTAAEDHVEDELLAGARSGREGQDAEGWGLPDYTDHIAFPSEWLSQRQLQTIARELAFSGDERRAFLADPDGFLQQHCWEALPEEVTSRCPELQEALEATWNRMWAKWTTAEKKAQAIQRVLGTQTPAERREGP